MPDAPSDDLDAVSPQQIPRPEAERAPPDGPPPTDTLSAPADDTARSSVLVAAGILLSRVAGLGREVAIAGFLGNSISADAFRASMQIPKLLQNLLGEGALSAAFIPVYAGLLAEGRRKDANRVAGAVAGLIAATTALIVLLGTLLARPITALLAPGFSGDKYELTVTLIRITTAGIGFVVLAAWCLGVLNAHRRFFLSYAAPVLWNVAQIAALSLAAGLAWSESGMVEALAWGVLAGGILQFLVQVPAVRRVAPGIRLSVDTKSREVRDVLRRFGPAVLGRGVAQIGAYLDLALASLLAVGAVNSMALAQILYLLPISLFAISVAAAELPELSRTDDDSELTSRLDRSNRRVTFLLAFTSVAYIFGGGALVATLYQRGEFGSDDTMLVWLILAAYSLGLVPLGTSRLLQNGLFARGDTAGPAKIAAIRVVVSAVIGLTLMFQAEQFVIDEAATDVISVVDGTGSIVEDGEVPATGPVDEDTRNDENARLRLGAVGLALGSAFGAWVELALLRRLLRRTLGTSPPLALPMKKVLPATAAAAIAIVALTLLARGLPVLIEGAVVLGGAGVVYIAVARATGVEEASTTVGGVLGRLRR